MSAEIKRVNRNKEKMSHFNCAHHSLLSITKKIRLKKKMITQLSNQKDNGIAETAPRSGNNYIK